MNIDEALFGSFIAGSIFSAYMVAMLFLVILLIVARWKIFVKANEKGWKTLIPIYGDYIWWKIGWKRTGMFWLMLLAGIAGIFLVSAGGVVIDVSLSQAYQPTVLSLTYDKIPLLFIGCALIVISGILELVALYKLCKSFGHGLGWTILFILFPSIMVLVLAFGASQHQGAQR